MLEWESNMVIEDSCAIIPELFVKCLLPKETFEIIMLFNSSDREKTNVDITKHLLICEERVFSDSLIGMPNFVKNLSLYRVGYLYPYVVMNSSIFQAFINKQIKWKICCLTIYNEVVFTFNVSINCEEFIIFVMQKQDRCSSHVRMGGTNLR